MVPTEGRHISRHSFSRRHFLGRWKHLAGNRKALENHVIGGGLGQATRDGCGKSIKRGRGIRSSYSHRRNWFLSTPSLF